MASKTPRTTGRHAREEARRVAKVTRPEEDSDPWLLSDADESASEESTSPDGEWPDPSAGAQPTPVVPRAVVPRELPKKLTAFDPALYFNGELSWLDFNWRVLYQALDDRTPLLERVRFLSIAENNLDEFVMKRMGGLMRQREAGVVLPSRDGRTPEEQLELLQNAIEIMRDRMGRLWDERLREELAGIGIVVRDYADLSKKEAEQATAFFGSRIYPILTPLAVDPGHPFPFISNLSLSLAVVMRHPDRGTKHFARVKIPTGVRWVALDTPGHVVPIEQVVAGNVNALFRGMDVESVCMFRVTRNADLRRDEEEADDLLKMISEELRERRFAPVVRLEVPPSMPPDSREVLMRELDLAEDSIFEVKGLMALADLGELVDNGPFFHRFEPWEPMIPPRVLREGESEDAPDMFAVIRAGDMLVHHPYDSFQVTVQRFIEEAAADPQVVAIKQTLYRTSDDSPIVRALARAAEADKEVAVLVELTARFDEEPNMEWAHVLEEAGVHVTYGLVGLKTHAKVALVLRDEDDAIRAYGHIGTGNYHTGTAGLYADIGVMTADAEIGNDLVNLFHYLTGYAPEQEYDHLLVAPKELRKAFNDLIEQEIRHAKKGRGGRIILKMNGLDDAEMINALYRASRAGVEIDLIVRGLCRLRPGIPGWSDRIRVRSIIGRFLEHDRIYWFENDGDPEVLIGSADWRRRNLDDRVEVMLPVYDPILRKRLRKILKYALEDNRRSWELQPTGDWIPRVPGEDDKERDYHERLMRRARKQRRKADPPWDIDPS